MDVQRPFAVVAPTLDADVLMRLARAEGAMFTAGQLQRLIPNRSVDGVRRTLERLTEQGVVLATPAGHAVVYRLNVDHVAAPAIRLLASQPTELLHRIEQDIAQWPVAPLYAAVFGSWARGEATTTSDIDVLVVVTATVDPDDVDPSARALQGRIRAWTGNEAQALVLTEGQVRHDPALRPVLENAAREGRSVAGDERWLRRALGLVAAA
ncbi:nucleotidyltransferase domain-containing protein [Cellulomonas sp. Sa3CUA2]|uniref:Nucleotidyltransferase domain-containing protein n=1 Tax=Cellulomonas avistercoris TaxID=2762242 RepID=A0ABR8QE70_9CELL|nr:nucleotidyltransferase domain-containing protein [Cellulomonas avistercoris]MBD7918670.1 nucleotidyltransferase domain-containing protein [Cellulomonas avistercoris]